MKIGSRWRTIATLKTYPERYWKKQFHKIYKLFLIFIATKFVSVQSGAYKRAFEKFSKGTIFLFL
jgi:hypothetical protein